MDIVKSTWYNLSMDFFHTLLVWLEHSKYFLLYIGAFTEGPAVMMTGGFLFRTGYVGFWPMYLSLVLGDFTSDFTYYLIGRFGTRHLIYKYGHFVGITPELIEKVEGRFLKYHQKILIISKMTMGLGMATATLVVSGLFKVPVKNFVIINILGGFVWTGFVVFLGYYFGDIYTQISGPMKIVFICVVITTFILLVRYVNKRLKNI